VEPKEVRVGTWYVDPQGEFWRHSKASGGVQVELASGRWGAVLPLTQGIKEFDLQQVSEQDGLVLDRFTKLNVSLMDPEQLVRDLRELRGELLDIVRQARAFQPPPALERHNPTFPPTNAIPDNDVLPGDWRAPATPAEPARHGYPVDDVDPAPDTAHTDG
jgi:hypothetical protein